MSLERLYRLALRVYPEAFRARFEDEMVEFLRDRLEEAREQRGLVGVLLAFPWAACEALHGGALERWQTFRKKAPTERRGEKMLSSLRTEWAQALRALRHRPALAATVVTTLSLGIGATSVVFTVIDTVLLRPLPFDEPERLVTVWNRYGTSLTSSSPPDYADRRRQSTLLEVIAAETSRSMNLSGEAEPRQVRAARVTSRYFDVFGVPPALGAIAFPDELEGGADRSVVLGWALWQELFGGERSALGKSLRLDGEPFAVVAVMPASFDMPRDADLWIPLVFTPAQLDDDYRGNEFLLTLGRVERDVSLAELEAEMDVIAQRVIERVPERRDFLRRNGWGARVVPLHEQLTGEARPALLVLGAAVLLVLVVTGANVAHMLLANAAAREGELAVRASLGATRLRLFRQLVLESTALSLVGAVLGLAFAAFLVWVLPGFVPHDVPRIETLALDGRAVLFTAVLAVIVGIACGLAPAWRLSKGRLRSALTSHGAPPAGRRLRSALVVSEVALAFLLMTGTGLLLRSYEALSSLDPGFEAEGRLSFGLTLSAVGWSEPEARIRFANDLRKRLRALPGVRDVAASDRVPLDGRRWSGSFHPEGYVSAPGERTPGADFNVVSPSYFTTLGIPLLAGRDFAETDTLGGPRVAIVDEWTARRFWPEGAVGRHINMAGAGKTPDLREIIGVAGHVKTTALDEAGRFQIYFPLTQSPLRRLFFTVASGVDPETLVPLLRDQVAELSPEIPIYGVRALPALVSHSLAFREFNLALLATFGLMALALAAVGIYGVLSYSVNRRTVEIGLRMALGARASTVRAHVLGEGMTLAGIGVLVGGLGALGASRFLESLLYGVDPGDGVSLALATGAVLLLAAVAAFLPARRASALDPVRALRGQA